MANRILLGAKRKSQITQDRRLRFLHFLCTLCAEYAFQCYEIVPRPALHSENLRDNGLIAGSLEALSVPGDLSKIGGRDFLHCTNLMELTAQGFTRTVSITLATKMQSLIPESISDQEIEKTCSPGINLNRNHELEIEDRKSTIKNF